MHCRYIQDDCQAGVVFVVVVFVVVMFAFFFFLASIVFVVFVAVFVFFGVDFDVDFDVGFVWPIHLSCIALSFFHFSPRFERFVLYASCLVLQVRTLNRTLYPFGERGPSHLVDGQILVVYRSAELHR